MVSKGHIGIGRQIVLLLAAILGAVLLSSGVALAATITCQAWVDCFGTKRADTLNGTSGEDYIYGRGGADTLRGFGEEDQLFGQGGNDSLFGGAEHEFMVGGAGDDALNGGGNLDSYYFEDGWGHDTITDEAVADSQIWFYDHLNTGGWDTDDMIVDLRSGAGPEAKDESGTNRINWEGNVVDTVFGGAGDDRITGNASADKLYGKTGADIIYGGGGDDEISVHDIPGGATDDTVHCGAGKDTVAYDTDLFGVISDNIDLGDCENLDAHIY